VEIYTSESSGSDETGDGSKDNPFKTVLQVQSVVNIQSSNADARDRAYKYITLITL